jgi:tRNA(fMet)-specific endonuclease VapC
MVVLDTDHVSLLQIGVGATARRLLERLIAIPPDEASTTIITYEEQTRGWMSYLSMARTIARQVAAYEKLRRHLVYFASIPVLPFDERAAVEYQRLRSSHRKLGSMDLRIAAIALTFGAKLLTRNLRDFKQIPQLIVEDWTQ